MRYEVSYHNEKETLIKLALGKLMRTLKTL